MSLMGMLGGALPAFRHRNFRLFWTGQLISLVGTQMQMMAMGWLVLRITNSMFYMGLVNALAMLPVLLFAMFAGILADRMSKRRLLVMTQSAFMIQAFALAILVGSGREALWSLMALAAMQGSIQAFDSPIRQSFVSEMVPQESVLSAVALNSSMFNGARVIGPAVAGFLIHYVKEAGCFYANAISFIAVLAGILMMRDKELFLKPNSNKQGAAWSQMKEGLRYVRGEKRIMGVLMALFATSLFGMPAFVLLPVFARDILKVGPKGLGFLGSAIGIGAVAATLALALVRKPRRQGLLILLDGIVFSVALAAFSQSRVFWFSMASVAVAGASLTANMAMANSTLQTLAPDHLRGRIMGIYIFVFMGMMPFGSLMMGSAAQLIGAPRTGACAGALCLLMLIVVAVRFPAVLKIGATDTQAVSGGG